MLISLLEQTIKIDQISLNLPLRGSDGKLFEIINTDIEKVVTIHRCSIDYGQNNNIIPTLLREGEYGTIIIALDETFIYAETFLETLLRKSLENNNCAIIFNEGTLVKPEFFKKEILYDENITNVKKYIKTRTILLEYYENYRM